MLRAAALHPAIVAALTMVLAGSALALPAANRGHGGNAALAEADRLTQACRDAYRLGAFAHAESLAARQLEIRRAHLDPEHPDVAASLMAVGEYELALGEDERAENAFREALAIRLRVLGPRHMEVAHAQRGLARALVDDHRFIEADSLCRAALETQRLALGEKDPETLVTEGLLGHILAAGRGQGLAGEKLLRQAMEGLRAIPEPSKELRLQLANIELDLCRVLTELSRYVEAVTLAEHGVATHREILGDSHPDYARALQALADALGTRTDYTTSRGKAPDLAMESYQILRRALGDENRLVLLQMGLASGGMTSWAEAEPWLRRWVDLVRRVFGEHHPTYGRALVGFGWRLIGQYRNDEAEAVLLQAEAILGDPARSEEGEVNAILNYRARLAYQMGDFAKAESLLRKRLVFIEREKGMTNRTRVSVLEGIGIMRAAQGDFAQGERYLSQAAETYERTRVRLGPGTARASFWPSPYERLAAARLKTGREADAWVAAERLQGLAIADMLMATGERSLSPLDKTREDSLVAVLADLENRLTAARAAAGLDSLARAEATTLYRELMGAEATWDAFQSEIERKQPAMEARTFPLERVQRSLDGETAIVGWLDADFGLGNGYGWGYVIRDRGPVHWVRLEVEHGRDWWSKPAQQFRERLMAPSRSALGAAADSSSQEARKFWDQRFAPLLPSLAGVHHLVVLPSRAVRGVPLEALQNPEGKLLAERYSVQYAPSATIHAWLMERASGRHPIHRGLLVGDPPFREAHLLAMRRGEDAPADSAELPDADVLEGVLRGDRSGIGRLPRLRWSRREIDGVAAALPQADRLVGIDASEQRIVELAHEHRLGDYAVLHFATHAIASDTRPEESALVLAQVGTSSPLRDTLSGSGRPLDGVLSAAEVMHEWSLKADLVTLSACETAQGRATSEGTFGIAQAFLRAGAHAVLVSLWPVDDEATALLMRRFYGLWLGSAPGKGGPARSKTEALRQAKAWLRDRRDAGGRRPFEHPYYWAGFVLIGDGR